MANELGNVAETGLLNHLLKNTAFPFAGQVRYFGIHVGDPGDDGQSGAEASGSSYTRIQVLGTQWNPAAGRQITNNVQMDFPTVTGSNITGCTHWTLWNHASGTAESNYLGKAAIPSAPVTFAVAETPAIPLGTFRVGWAAGGLSDHAANGLAAHLVLHTEFAEPTALYAFYSEGNPGDDFSGINEPLAINGYARALASGAFGTSVSLGAVDNDAIIQFPVATGNWRSGAALTHSGLYDAATGGNPLCYFPLTSGKIITVSKSPAFAVGDFNFTID